MVSVMLKLFSGKVSKTPRGSLRSLRVSSPVLIMVVVTFRFINPSTLALGVDVLTVRPGAAETTTTEATRAAREAGREEENIVRRKLNLGNERAWVKQAVGPRGQDSPD